MRNPWTIRFAMVCAASAVVMAVVVKSGKAQPGDSCPNGSAAQPAEIVLAQGIRGQPNGAPFEVRLWDYLRRANYQNWAPFPGTNGDFYEGHSPHGAFVKTYINRIAASEPKNPPHGSILVKENYGMDKKEVMAITVMYRTKGYDPEHNDWYWVKYEADGRVSRMNQMNVAGKPMMCIECHGGAKGKDFIFGNDGT